MQEITERKKLSSFQIISIGFTGAILLGALLLMLPFSSSSGKVTPFLDALFTATSATCVTGLIVYDTSTYWSGFGQGVILLLIQVGGMGVITVAALLATISGRKISLMQRSTLQEAIAAPKVGGIVRLTKFIVKTTLVIELAGALIMLPTFCRDFGARGVWMAVFHSVSAFCNAGFDLMGVRAPFSSLTSYAANPVINVTIMLLIVIGGIGFLTWDDIRTNKFHLRRYRMQSKVILSTTAVLIVLPAVYFFFLEFPGLGLRERALVSLFQSITPRTAGFNTVDFNVLSEAGRFIIILLMLIGGSSGSTAGGMKTNTVAVLFATAVSTFFHKEHAHFFDRRIDDDVVKNAVTILVLYIFLMVFGGITISIIDGLPLLDCLFEAASAVGTAGLSVGVTAAAGMVSRLILIVLMFCGRVGGLTLVFAALSGAKKSIGRYPLEKITVG
ncbi:MAG: Trk family potassium uptake protein [Oscillospiraceae bacterium]|nr:Trk family potassium uptake protein [Oscillospiraceae bacterium]